MKKIIVFLFSLFSFSAFATVDSNTEVYVLVEHVQTGEFFVQKAPIIGCWGIAKGPELLQLTRPYIVNELGCGSSGTMNINALTCAKVVETIDTDDLSTFKEITLNISKCEQKNNPDFIDGIKKVVKLNFATKEIKDIKLNLVK